MGMEKPTPPSKTPFKPLTEGDNYWLEKYHAVLRLCAAGRSLTLFTHPTGLLTQWINGLNSEQERTPYRQSARTDLLTYLNLCQAYEREAHRPKPKTPKAHEPAAKPAPEPTAPPKPEAAKAEQKPKAGLPKFSTSVREDTSDTPRDTAANDKLLLKLKEEALHTLHASGLKIPEKTYLDYITVGVPEYLRQLFTPYLGDEPLTPQEELFLMDLIAGGKLEYPINTNPSSPKNPSNYDKLISVFQQRRQKALPKAGPAETPALLPTPDGDKSR